jgi:hydroxypyruvate isomerase
MGVFARGTTLEDACKEAARLGIKGFDLRGPADWPTLKKYGLVSSMYQPTAGASIPNGLNRKENHARIDQGMRAAIDESAAAVFPTSLRFPEIVRAWRTRKARTTAFPSEQHQGYAESKGVTICMGC